MTHDNSYSPLFVRIKGRVEEQSMQMPFIFSPISAGFPSPALDFMDKGIDLNKILIKNISASFRQHNQRISFICSEVFGKTRPARSPNKQAVAVQNRFSVHLVQYRPSCLPHPLSRLSFFTLQLLFLLDQLLQQRQGVHIFERSKHI